MSYDNREYEELTSAQKINQKKGRMEEYALGILPKKSNVAGFIPKDRHQWEHSLEADGSVTSTIVKRPRQF
jgi:hypothetical protein